MLSDIVGRNKILLHQSPDNWESAIELAAKPLLENNYIKADYVKAMIDTVKKYGPYIVISKGVALAHASSDKGVKAIGLSVMTLSTPINFGNIENDPVKIIFCLAATDSDTHLQLIKSLVSVINEEWKIDCLSRAATIDEFVKSMDSLEQKGK